MSRYLNALKQSGNPLTGNLKNLKNLKNPIDEIQKPLDAEPNKPKELAKGGFLGSLGSALSDSEKTQAANDTGQDADSIAYFRWRIHFTNKEPLTVSFSPMVNHAGALACYPNAIAAEQADRDQHRQSTGEDAALGDAVPRCEVEPVAHSLTFAGTDDRRTCRQCSNLKGLVCSVACPGGAVSAPRGYRPAPDLLQRCAAFAEPQTNK